MVRENSFTSAGAISQLERAKEIQHILCILHQWGIHTVGQFAALSRDDLAARLGTRAVDLWERANGSTKRLLRLVSPPECFIESFDFENAVETVEPLLFMLRRFLQQLAARLNAIYLVAKELRLRIRFDNKSQYERVFKIPQPTNNEEVLFRMLHIHLENFTSKHPISAVELEAQPSKPVRQQFRLFEIALRDPAQLHETLAELIGLLGAERVGTPLLEETHRPDAFHMEPFRWEFSQPERQSNDSVEGTLRLTRRAPSTPPATGASADDDKTNVGIPLRRFRNRVNATVLLENNQPVHLRAADMGGMTKATDGPFAVSGNWWDERAWAQVEWDVELENGTIARCHCDAQGWAVDGIYD